MLCHRDQAGSRRQPRSADWPRFLLCLARSAPHAVVHARCCCGRRRGRCCCRGQAGTSTHGRNTRRTGCCHAVAAAPGAPGALLAGGLSYLTFFLPDPPRSCGEACWWPGASGLLLLAMVGGLPPAAHLRIINSWRGQRLAEHGASEQPRRWLGASSAARSRKNRSMQRRRSWSAAGAEGIPGRRAAAARNKNQPPAGGGGTCLCLPGRAQRRIEGQPDHAMHHRRPHSTCPLPQSDARRSIRLKRLHQLSQDSQ